MSDDRPAVNANLIVDLDCVLDTRLPVVFALHTPTALSGIEDSTYRKRIKDVFGNIPYSVFREYYNKRNKNVLKLATPTPMLELLGEYCLEAHSLVISEADILTPKIFVNTYPYDLNEDESLILLKLFYSMLPVDMDIDIIHKSNKELTPEFVANNATTFIKYDIITWLEYHNSIGELAKHPLIDVSCIGPMIANGNKPTSELTQDDFDNVRAVFGPLTNLVLLQTRMFSVS